VSDPHLVLHDSIASVEPADAGALVVSGSHGGTSAARFALAVPLVGVVFNDAGVGKDRAGVAGLELLDRAGVPALAVGHDSARIGDAGDTLRNGVVSCANGEARRRGVEPGQSTREALRRLAAGRSSC
jgi:hypothetical protein